MNVRLRHYFKDHLSLFISYSLLIFILFISSCSGNKPVHRSLDLDDKYDKVQNIIAIANCTGPGGTYTTEVHSSQDGSCYFYQKRDSESPPFIVRINSKNQGFIIDTSENVLDTISEEMKAMINGHEIHKMHINPDLFFTDIAFDKEVKLEDETYEVFRGIDKLDNPIKLFYQRDKSVISKIELLNPIDTSEIILVINRSWKDSEFGKLAKEVDIVQAEKDTFTFDFHTININSLKQ